MNTPQRTPEDHWNDVYRRRTPEGVSWYQAEASVSLALVDGLDLATRTPIIDIGGGASTFVDGLVARGYSDVTVLDVAQAALESARDRLPDQAAVEWLEQDLLRWTPTRRYGLWHDRAVFHFLTGREDQRRYVELLRRGVTGTGYVILATFSPDGPDRCSGLPVCRYGVPELAAKLGNEFEVVDARQEDHVTPGGKVQPFTWVVARRK